MTPHFVISAGRRAWLFIVSNGGRSLNIILPFAWIVLRPLALYPCSRDRSATDRILWSAVPFLPSCHSRGFDWLWLGVIWRTKAPAADAPSNRYAPKALSARQQARLDRIEREVQKNVERYGRPWVPLDPRA